MGQKTIYLIISIFIAKGIFSQAGCTDPQAVNFDASAIENDGSCFYQTTAYTLGLVSDLSSDLLSENSGLSLINESLWTINDSGNNTTIYELDSLGNITREVYVDGVINVDWEALTQNSTHLFIGDFGNNAGSRQNLSIIKINKSELLNNSTDTIFGQTLFFRYSDQFDFSGPTNGHNYDCEAFIASDDTLSLFSKNWQNQEVRKYNIPCHWEGEYVATFSESFDVGGLITDAAFDSISDQIVLLGYDNLGTGIYSSFIWMLWDYNSGNVFNGNKRRFEVGSMFTVGQTEGICLSPQLIKGFISSEQISSVITIPPKLFEFNLEQYVSNSTVMYQEAQGQPVIQCYPNPFHSKVFIRNYKGKFHLHDSNGGRLVYQGDYQNQGVDLSVLSPGFYFLKVGHSIFKMVKN